MALTKKILEYNFSPRLRHTILNLYGKSGEESDLGWILLDLVKCLESLGNFQNGLDGNHEVCQSGEKIIHALKISDSQEKTVIKNTYKVGSMWIAHSSMDTAIEPALVEKLRKLNRRLIMDSLGKAN